MQRGGTVYIMTNKRNTTLYVGATGDIISRLIEHKTKVNPRSFTARYNLTKLVYLKHFSRIEEAFARESYIKGKLRSWKEDLINSTNPNWNDLSSEIEDW